LFFLTDDQRNDQLGVAGHPVLQTPNIDNLARDGVLFGNMFVTTSICAASRATILTGLYERSHKFTFRTPPLGESPISKSYSVLLREAGYNTGFVGKFGIEVEEGLTDRMFDFFRPLNRTPYFKEQADGGQRHITELAGDSAIQFLRGQSSEKPFCLSMSFNAPHAEDADKENHYPWPKAVDGMYETEVIAPPRLSNPHVFESQPAFLRESLNRQRWFWRWDTPEKYDRNIRAYYRMISGVDNVIGRVLGELRELGLHNSTVVIFSSDNGYYLGSRGFAGKWSHYEESLRVPLIVFDPRMDVRLRGGRVEEMALNADIPATILELAGVRVPTEYQGNSVALFLRGEQPKGWRTDFFCEHLMDFSNVIPKWEGVRDQRWVYARYFQQQPVSEFLNDLETDPDQLLNLVDEPEYEDILDQLRLRANELRDQYGGPYSREKFPTVGPEW
jgi:arylsulfatase A-like enzyme